jgi:GNAT superfamily N-acetyltransferase
MADEQNQNNLELVVARTPEDLPPWASRNDLAKMFNEKMQPYNDALEDVYKGIDYALSNEPGKGGFIVIARMNGELVGGLTMLETGMSGFIPENILLFVVVDESMRGKGVGQKIIARALDEAKGDVKLHVDHDNPARRLYERLGFTSKYLEMRYKHGAF